METAGTAVNQAQEKLDNAQKNLDRVKEDENKKKAALAKIRAEGEALGEALGIDMNREAHIITQEINDLIKKKTEEAKDSEKLPWKNWEEFGKASHTMQDNILALKNKIKGDDEIIKGLEENTKKGSRTEIRKKFNKKNPETKKKWTFKMWNP